MDSFDSTGPLDSSGPFDASGSLSPDAPQTTATSVATEARTPLTLRRQLSLSALWLGTNAISAALLPIVLPIQILLFIAPGAVGDAQQAEYLGWLSALGAIVALVVPPLVGARSDRTTARMGRRRPYILIGVVVALVGAGALARADDLNTLTVSFLILQFGFNFTLGAYQGLLPDLTPETQRGAASGYMGLMTILGNVGSLALAGALLANVTLTNAGSGAGRAAIVSGSAIFYFATAAVMALTAIVTVVWTPETPFSATDAAALRPAPRGVGRLERGLQSLRMLWLEPWKSHNFTWVFLTRGFVMLGLTLFLTFIEYYFANVVHVTDFVSATAWVAGLALVGAIMSALTLGILSDHMNRALLVGVSTALMALPALAFVVLPGRIPLWPLGLVFGLGYGAYTSVDWALAVDALPVQANAGKDLGIWSAASTLPAILAPALGGAVIALVDGVYHQTTLGYQAIFALAAIFLALGAVFVSFIRGDQPAQAVAATQAAVVARPRRPGLGWRLAGASQGGQARGFLRFWPIWERIYDLFLPTKEIPHAPHGVLRVHFGRYHGKPITLPDGTRIARGARIIELHINSLKLGAASRTATPFQLMRLIADDLGALAAWAGEPDQRGPAARSIAIHGLTLMGRAAPRLGFTLRERPVTLIAWFDRFFMQGLLTIYNPDGLKRLRRGTTFGAYPTEIWMSQAELLRRYGAR